MPHTQHSRDGPSSGSSHSDQHRSVHPRRSSSRTTTASTAAAAAKSSSSAGGTRRPSLQQRSSATDHHPSDSVPSYPLPDSQQQKNHHHHHHQSQQQQHQRHSAASKQQQQQQHQQQQPAALAPPPQDHNNRDSFASIVDDPFFLRYDPAISHTSPPAALAAAADLDPSHHPNALATTYYEEAQTDSDESDEAEPWQTSYRESLIIGRNPPVSYPLSTMDGFNIAVIGATGVGKSTFIQRVLGLPRPTTSGTSTVRLVVDNVTHTVTLLELDLEHFDLTSSQPIQWPKHINGHSVPSVDGALILYDVLSKESVRMLPQTMTALTRSGLPSILVANKCEQPDDEWEVDPDGMAAHKFFTQCLASYKISETNPEASRACLQAMLRGAVSHRKADPADPVLRKRAQSAVNLEAPEANAGRPTSQQSKHSRASSELSVLRPYPNQQGSESYRTRVSRSPRKGVRTSDKPGTDYFLDVDGSDGETQVNSDDGSVALRPDETQQKLGGVLFDDLVDRLLALRLSRADNNFSDIFLCLYRKFATPGDLFAAIMIRLDRVKEDKSSHYLATTATQLRIIEIVAKWVSLYPGDFARVSKRKSLQEFVNQLSTEPIFCIASQQMRRSLSRCVMEDDDTGWAAADDEDIATEKLAKDVGAVTGNIGKLVIDEELDEESERARMQNGSGGYIQFHSYDEYEKEASLLEPTDYLPMDKERYHSLMEFSDDEIAEELTRIDWIMYSSIRIRDFVRYVSLSASKKEKCKSLRNVNRMINHFNHVAKWVANLILLRDKAKHRAGMLERFMNISIKLRQLNNYNGLAAVLAGINGTAIHRLAQTRALVPADVQKRFARTVILMGTQKSHFAYRLAWENSPLPRIPFIPLHLRDLVSAEEGSKTFVGPSENRVNWKKFEVLGEVLLPLMRSQGTAYPNLNPNMAIRELILACKMPTDDEEIYQRSVEVESANSSVFDPTKKKFPWFAK